MKVFFKLLQTVTAAGIRPGYATVRGRTCPLETPVDDRVECG